MLAAARAAVREPGIAELVVDSDPEAESSYLRHGARRVGEARSPSTGRLLPRLFIGT